MNWEGRVDGPRRFGLPKEANVNRARLDQLPAGPSERGCKTGPQETIFDGDSRPDPKPALVL
jgi:hypothetical protein